MEPKKTISKVESIYLMEGDIAGAEITHGFTGLILKMRDGRIVVHGSTDVMQPFTEIMPEHVHYEQIKLLIA